MSAAEIIAELSHLSSAELFQVQAKLRELVEQAGDRAQPKPGIGDPALGIRKDRTDLPDDSVEVSHMLREGMMRRSEAGTDATES